MKDLPENLRRDLVFVRLCIIRLGYCAGKIKYAILNERDVNFPQLYSIYADLVIDKNGNGAKIYAYAYLTEDKSTSPNVKPLHDLIWETHCGPIEHGYKVYHRNGITMDNRLENLGLMIKKSHRSPELLRQQLKQQLISTSKVNKSKPSFVSSSSSSPSSSVQKETESCCEIDDASSSCEHIQHSLYWCAIQKLPPHLFNEWKTSSSDFNGKFFDLMGNLRIDETEDKHRRYYECYYPPCINIESVPFDFSICGRCQEVRYCGSECQQLDWPSHKKYCREDLL